MASDIDTRILLNKNVADPVQMTDEMVRLFPGVHYILAVTLPSDEEGSPLVEVHVNGLKPVVEDLHNVATKSSVQLLPAPDELLLTRMPDGRAVICTNSPVWRWL